MSNSIALLPERNYGDVLIERGGSLRPFDDFTRALDAMNVLNSWVRTSQGYMARRAVYYLKRQALVEAQARCVATHRRVQVEVVCRGCGGTGRYEDQWGQTFDHCWDCSNSGKAKLRFIETTLQSVDFAVSPLHVTEFKWHSPEHSFPYIGWLPPKPLNGDGTTNHDAAWESSGDWSVNRDGASLTPDQAAGYLNIVETYWLGRPGPRYDYHGGTWDDFTYSLPIGELPRQRCSICKERRDPNEVGGGHRARRYNLNYTFFPCRTCKTERFPDGLIFDAAPFPIQLMTRNIFEWMERRRGPGQNEAPE